MSDSPEVLLAHDGSPSAAAAMGIAAALLPGHRARVVHLWSPALGDAQLRKRVWSRSKTVDDMIALAEREGEAEAVRVGDEGVALARAAGFTEVVPEVVRCMGTEGLELAKLAEEHGSAAVVVGARGLNGAASLGRTSDVAIHYATAPILVVPHPLLTDERAAALSGPVVVGVDGSEGSDRARDVARSLFAGRDIQAVVVGDEGPLEGATHVTAGRHRRGGRAYAEALAAHAAHIGAGAIVVGSRGRSATKELLLGSVAMDTVHHAHRPVLVVPPESRHA